MEWHLILVNSEKSSLSPSNYFLVVWPFPLKTITCTIEQYDHICARAPSTGIETNCNVQWTSSLQLAAIGLHLSVSLLIDWFTNLPVSLSDLLFKSTPPVYLIRTLSLSHHLIYFLIPSDGTPPTLLPSNRWSPSGPSCPDSPTPQIGYNLTSHRI